MIATQKVIIILLLVSLLNCEGNIASQNQKMLEQPDPCAQLLTKLTTCVGGVPALVGECDPDTAEFLLDLSCGDLLGELGVG